MADLHDLGAAEIARRIRAGSLSPVDLLMACLKRIEAVDPVVQAWVHLDREAAVRVAEQREVEARAQRLLGALHGVPLALKDIFDAAGLPTTGGAGSFAHRRPAADATSVARLRAAGGIVLGKVTTTAFAFLDPSPTRNPWNPEHTPGGSSSGPAAAVAARMVPLAFGSQTGGSVLRPAAYCGVVGLKPSYGRISRRGVLPLAWTLDHPGVLCRTVEDAALLLQAMAGPDAADPGCSSLAADDYVAAARAPRPPRLLVLDDFLARAQPEARESFERTVADLAAAGARIGRAAFPSRAEALISTHAVVMQSEVASVHRRLLEQHADRYAPRIRAYVETGALVTAADYVD